MTDNHSSDSERNPEAEPRVKKPYKTPVLHVWGTLKDLTQSTGQSGASDGGRSRHANRTR